MSAQIPASETETSRPAQEATGETRPVIVPILGGEVLLDVPVEISDRMLNQEIARQDLNRRRLLELIEGLDGIIDSNREIFVCPVQKLHGIAGKFLDLAGDLRRFIDGLGGHASAVPELEAARGDLRAFFAPIDTNIDEVERLQDSVFHVVDGELLPHREGLQQFRKKLAKTGGRVRTELQKFFAHLFSNDPRNLYRPVGKKSQQEILFLQFRQDVEITEQLYNAIRRLDRYMRGAIVPSDLLQMTAERIERERSIACLFEPDYALFLSALIDEIIERLLPELDGILDLDGIWYDDFESIQAKRKSLSEVCLMFRVLYVERSGLREKVHGRKMIYKSMDQRCRDQIWAILDVLDTYRYKEMAQGIREIDQTLVDLESTLLQWERGLAHRAFSQPSWRDAEPLPRRGDDSVVYKSGNG